MLECLKYETQHFHSISIPLTAIQLIIIMEAKSQNQATIPESKRILSICDFIQSHQLTPKKFLCAFLTNPHDKIVDRRKKWPASGLDSTIELFTILKGVITKSAAGKKRWNDIVQEEAIAIVLDQEAPRGNYPNGGYQSSATVTAEYLSEETKRIDNEKLTIEHTPFLYNLIFQVLSQSRSQKKTPDPNEVDENWPCDKDDPEENELVNHDGVSYAPIADPQLRLRHRHQSVASVICGMVAYVRNRRHNGLQLRNGVQFVSCGITERVNNYLMYHGLSCGRRMATEVLKTISDEAEHTTKSIFRRRKGDAIAPFICIDNLDIEERVHTHGPGHRNRMFHGTWGYVHFPSKDLLATLDASQLSLESFTRALSSVPSFQIEPSMLMPNLESEEHYKLVWKSQIAQVMYKYIAIPNKKENSISLNPPPIELVSPEIPDIRMLKLMEQPENSADGIGKVMEAIVQQTGLKPEDFFCRLQVMDGDLATCRTFHSLRSLRIPSYHKRHNLENITFQLGAAHTLWNVAHGIFKAHFGDDHNSLDTGVWRCLNALSIPLEKAIPKKNYSLMIKYMEQVHEATIWYGLRVIMNTDETVIDQSQLQERPKMDTSEWNQIINKFYDRFCTGEARSRASKQNSPNLHNLLIRLQDFGTVIEANRAMKAGDVGRLMNMWKQWENHFVAKDLHLENQNYFLKFFYNQTGVGTQVERLKNIFSLNIDLLRSLLKSIKIDSGSTVFTQSHKNVLTANALNVFNLMANGHKIFDLTPSNHIVKVRRVDNSYTLGYQNILKELSEDPQLMRFKLNMSVNTTMCEENKEDNTNPENNNMEL
ncbi:hypothetical protein PGT21_012114 [Puccinia graminis f. sp. tritici]|uniref:DUF6589 domain-containing protein n=1 Tax=Puccinia graminis f. sp. tritici TaxID=56615 RepID=A0A5B0M8E3_PUCGR|nr:hypothetical protein PGT21_012114 [Puccinia graminis f. sp. tritici]